MNGDESLSYPGEFEVMRSKALAGTWGQTGEMVMTNYRVRWTPSRYVTAPSISFDLADITSASITRSVKTLFLMAVLRISTRGGAVYEIHPMQEDIHRVLHVINDYRRRERYRPGKLFEEGS